MSDTHTCVEVYIHPISLVLSSQNAQCINTPASLFDKLLNTKEQCSLQHKQKKKFQMKLHAFYKPAIILLPYCKKTKVESVL